MDIIRKDAIDTRIRCQFRTDERRGSRIEIVELTEEHLERASELFIRTYIKAREIHKNLPARYADKKYVLPLLRATYQQSMGAAAMEDQEIVGYLMGLHIRENRIEGKVLLKQCFSQ